MSDLTIKTWKQFDALKDCKGEREVLVIGHTFDRKWGGNFTVRAVPPTWRDIPAILRGRYQPKIVVKLGPTPEQFDRILKEVWGKDDLDKRLHTQSRFLEDLR